MVVRGFGTNKVSIESPMIIEWNECVDPMMELLPLDFDTISENGRNIYE